MKVGVGGCRTRRGYGAWRGTPVGRQFASGSSPDRRDAISFLPASFSGTSTPFGIPCARSPTGPPPCHTPEKSGRPSGNFGAGPCGAACPRPRPVFRPPEPAAVVAAFGLGEAVGSGGGALCRCAATGTAHAPIA